MNIEVIVQPPVYPVSLNEMKQWLRLDPSSGSPDEHPDDEMIQGLIAGVTDQCERATCRAFIQQTIRLTTGYWGIAGIELKRPPLIGLIRVQYYDSSNVLQNLSASNYVLVTGGMVPKLQLASGASWPEVYGREDAIAIDYTVGYEGTGSPTEDFRVNVPQTIKTAIKMGVQALYDNMRPEELDRLNMAQAAILASQKVYSFTAM